MRSDPSTLEEVAQEIYWAAYDQYLGPDFRHPLGFNKNVAWSKASEVQREFCRHQARRVLNYLNSHDT